MDEETNQYVLELWTTPLTFESDTIRTQFLTAPILWGHCMHIWYLFDASAYRRGGFVGIESRRLSIPEAQFWSEHPFYHPQIHILYVGPDGPGVPHFDQLCVSSRQRSIDKLQNINAD